jgi:anti-sigma factor RsiW
VASWAAWSRTAGSGPARACSAAWSRTATDGRRSMATYRDEGFAAAEERMDRKKIRTRFGV